LSCCAFNKHSYPQSVINTNVGGKPLNKEITETTMIKKMGIFLLTILVMMFNDSIGQELDNGQIPFYAEPYYNYKPLKISVGRYSELLKTNDPTELIRVSEQIKADIDNINIETLYVMSVRLYDLGKKDEAFYWFQTAKLRARIFIEMLDPKKIGGIGSEAFEHKQLFGTFNQLAGGYINGYGFNDVEKGVTTMEVIRNEIKNIKSYKEVYKKVKFVSDSDLEGIKEKKEKELEEMIAYSRANKEEIKKKRIEAGIQDKY
jgi:hypothetical protein